MTVLVGIALVVVGFLARINPLLVIIAAALATGLAAGLSPLVVIAAYGKAFNDNRYVSLVWVVLVVIGVLERYGLQAYARIVIGRVKGATPGGLFILYFVARQITAALGLQGLGGHAQMVRPLLAPMAEAAAEARLGPLSDDLRERVRATAAASDNIALFFGEDIFFAIASILLIKGFLAENGISAEPQQLSLWAIPTAAAAFVVHALRMRLFDRSLRKAQALQNPDLP